MPSFPHGRRSHDTTGVLLHDFLLPCCFACLYQLLGIYKPFSVRWKSTGKTLIHSRTVYNFRLLNTIPMIEIVFMANHDIFFNRFTSSQNAHCRKAGFSPHWSPMWGLDGRSEGQPGPQQQLQHGNYKNILPRINISLMQWQSCSAMDEEILEAKMWFSFLCIFMVP